MKTSMRPRTSRLGRHILAAAISALALAGALDAQAQATYKRIDTIRTMAAERGPYRIEIEQKCLVVIDPATQERLASASLEIDGMVTLSGRVGTLERRDQATLDEINSAVESFNLGYRSARLELDPLTGDLTMTRTILVDAATSGELALEIVRFGDLVHEERAKFLASQRSAQRYCALTCRPIPPVAKKTILTQ